MVTKGSAQRQQHYNKVSAPHLVAAKPKVINQAASADFWTGPFPTATQTAELGFPRDMPNPKPYTFF